MIKKMRFKFIAITAASLILLLLSILLAMNIVLTRNTAINSQALLTDLANNDGVINIKPTDPLGPPNQIPHNDTFSIKLNHEGEVIEILNQNSRVDYDYAMELLDSALSNSDTDNYISLVQDKSYGQIVVFADQGAEYQLLNELRSISYFIGGISIAIILVIVYFLSKLVTKPIEDAFKRQKRFVSDSSHELKTPLSIISANVDLMEMEIGENEWLSQIRMQSRRMNKLIHELLQLAKTENEIKESSFSEFNLSETIYKTILPFEVIAYEYDKEIKFNVEENIYLNGNESRITEMLEALTDNAIKYSDEKSAINVSLKKSGNKKIIMFSNKSIPISETELSKLFDTFYRPDVSRSRETGSYGLGLSIVNNIVTMHKGKIDATYEKGIITFKITI